MTFKEHLIIALGGYITPAQEENEQPQLITAQARSTELDCMQKFLGGNILDWRDLLLKCRLGGQLLKQAAITDIDGVITASVTAEIKGGVGDVRKEICQKTEG